MEKEAHLRAAVSSPECCELFPSSELEQLARRQYCCWLPVPLPLPPLPLPGPPSLPADIAVWLLELRHAGDQDDWLYSSKSGVHCNATVQHVWLLDKEDDGEHSDGLMQSPLAGIALEITRNDEELKVEDSCCISASVVFPADASKRGVEAECTSYSQVPISTPSLENVNISSSSTNNHESEHIVWNPIYLAINTANSPHPYQREVVYHGGDSGNRRGTKFRMLCQTVIDEVNTLLVDPTEYECRVQKHTAVCTSPYDFVDVSSSETYEHCSSNAVVLCGCHFEDDIANTKKRGCSKCINFVAVDDVESNNLEVNCMEATVLANNIESIVKGNDSVTSEVNCILHKDTNSCENISVTNLCFVNTDCSVTDCSLVIDTVQENGCAKILIEGQVQDSVISNCIEPHNAVFKDVENIAFGSQDIENTSGSINDTELYAEYGDLFSLCDNAKSLIQETLNNVSVKQCNKARNKSGSLVLSSDLCLPPEDKNYSTDDDASFLIHKQSSIFDINSIFDNGKVTPKRPPRLRKKGSMSKEFLEHKKEVKCFANIEVGESAGHKRCQSEAVHIFLKKQTAKMCEIDEAIKCKVKTMSLQNLSSSHANDTSQLKSLTGASGHAEIKTEAQEIKPGCNSSSLQVKVPQARPISSFEFSSCTGAECGTVSSWPPIQHISSLENISGTVSDNICAAHHSSHHGVQSNSSGNSASWKCDMLSHSFFPKENKNKQDKEWYSSTDGEGRLYFFAENSNESSWALPIVTASKSEERTQSKMSEDNSECDSPPLRGEGVQKSRNVKAHSMFLPLEKEKDNCGRTSSIPRNWLEICGVDKDVQKYGNMKRKKIMENGKKMSKKWVSVFVVLTEDTLCFYKDLKSSQSMGLQPELSMQLPGASVESGEKLSRRKHVFLVISGGMQILCDCNSADTALEWRAAIKSAVEKLVRPQYLPSAQKVIREQEKAERTVERTASMRVRNRDASYEDLMSSNEEQQTKIRDRLKKFFIRRPTREILASKGIYKDEPVFGSHLVKICPINQPYVPEFVKKCIAVIESKDENMKADGLYRACGNLSHVQKIRLQVDQNNLSVLETEEDVHVLTGALKLFFRELKEPLIPYHLFNKAVDAGRMHRTKDEKTKMFREVVKQLPTQNRDTLRFLLQHLKRVTFYEKFNRMHIPNLAIVFGPTVMWRETEYQQNMAIDYMQQNLVIEYFLQQVDEIFS